MNHKNENKIFKYIIFTSFIIFLALFISQNTGYFEYKNSKKVALTNEQIKAFEKDVNEGKNVDLTKYIEINNKDYQNKISKTGLFISNTLKKSIEKIISKSFKVLEKFVGE
ncbi:MAG: hypothetical protein IKG27_03810 [Bacilli bacterium]|nr:hypothetical protein [Bacilli bacterium]